MGEYFNDSETDIKRCIVMISHCFDALELCGFKKEVKLDNGAILPVSRSYSDDLKRSLMEYIRMNAR